MKRIISVAFAIGFFTLLAQPLKAEAAHWVCNLDADIHGASVGFIFSAQILKGTGEINCRNTETEAYVTQPVELKFVGAGVGFDFTIVRSAHMLAVDIGTNDGAASLIGSYSVGVSAGATLIHAGYTIDSAIRVSRADGLGFDIGMMGEDAVGLGVRLQGMVLHLNAI